MSVVVVPIVIFIVSGAIALYVPYLVNHEAENTVTSVVVSPAPNIPGLFVASHTYRSVVDFATQRKQEFVPAVVDIAHDVLLI